MVLRRKLATVLFAIRFRQTSAHHFTKALDLLLFFHRFKTRAFKSCNLINMECSSYQACHPCDSTLFLQRPTTLDADERNRLLSMSIVSQVLKALESVESAHRMTTRNVTFISRFTCE